MLRLGARPLLQQFVFLPRHRWIGKVSPPGDLNQVVCSAEPFAAPDEAQVDHSRQHRAVLEVAPVRGDAKNAGRRFSRMPGEDHRRLASQAEPDHKLGKAPRVQGSRAVGLEEVLPGPRTEEADECVPGVGTVGDGLAGFAVG